MLKTKRSRSAAIVACILLCLLFVPTWVNADPAVTQDSQTSSDDNSATGSTSITNGGGHNSVTGIGAVAGNGSGNTAVGENTQVVNGSNNSVAGVGASATNGDGNTAIGTNSQVVSGNGNKAVGAGALAGGGNYNSAIGAESAAIGCGNTAAGAGAGAGGVGNTAVGVEALAYGEMDTAIGTGAAAYGTDSVAIGAGSVADRDNTVSVGSIGNERQITNVAPGVYDTDAVNVSQLRAVGDKVNELGATAMAMTGLAPMGYDPNRPTQLSAAIGTYGGQQGIAIGIYHYTASSVMLNAAFGMCTDGGEKAGRIGITWLTGSSKSKDSKVTDNTVAATNLPAKDTQTTATESNGKQAAAQGNIVDRVNKIINDSNNSDTASATAQ